MKFFLISLTFLIPILPIQSTKYIPKIIENLKSEKSASKALEYLSEDFVYKFENGAEYNRKSFVNAILLAANNQFEIGGLQSILKFKFDFYKLEYVGNGRVTTILVRKNDLKITEIDKKVISF
ncbi:unnamed protein product [Caenorhabditis angaria]|uniref:Nuclear transport factor 2 family protein n=1 Tax=Caenorhabditis angaria TaxID=860376 RepID=A0A9P1IKZ8_9PELO|nr:unnamed protein product [Caenorhabditis angaria]